MVIVLVVHLENSSWITDAMIVERTPTQEVENKDNAICVLSVHHVTEQMETVKPVLLESSRMAIPALPVKPTRNQKKDHSQNAMTVRVVQLVTL
jgi:hypothetical protein